MSCRCRAKVVVADSPEITIGDHWARSQRTTLEVHDDRFALGDRTIPFDSVRGATVVRVRDVWGVGPVLILDTDDGFTQIGMNPWCRCVGSLPFAVVRDEVLQPRDTRRIVRRRIAIGAVSGFLLLSIVVVVWFDPPTWYRLVTVVLCLALVFAPAPKRPKPR